jgi:amino acid transporter
MFGTLGYAEEEFWASLWKLIVVVAFLIAAIILNCGGGPSSGLYGTYVGGRYASLPVTSLWILIMTCRYWHDPGSLADGFKASLALLRQPCILSKCPPTGHMRRARHCRVQARVLQ